MPGDGQGLVAELRESVGVESVSDWLTISPEAVLGLASLTHDPEPLHCEPDYAADGPFGRLLGQGALLVALMPVVAQRALGPPPASMYSLNYGFDRLRFVSPVLAGDRVRFRFTRTGVEPNARGALVRVAVTVEVEAGDRPALVADWMYVLVREDEGRPLSPG